MSDEPDRCYICLGTADEPPPLSNPKDPKDLKQVCPCSLRAHKRCLTDWASDFEFNKLRDDDALTNTINTPRTGHYRFGIPAGTLVNGRYSFFQSKVKCPQCSTPLLIFMQPSKLLTLNGLVNSNLNDLVKTGALAVFGSAGAFTLSITVMGIFVSSGLKMFSMVAPESVLMKLLDLKSKDIDTALMNEKVDFRQLGIVGLFPIFLYGLRANNVYMDVLSTAYPLLFFKSPLNEVNLLKLGPKFFLLLSQPLKRLYNIVYSLTLNRIYYRWTRSVKPIFMADRVSLKELDEIEEETSDLNELKDYEFLQRGKSKPNVFQRVFNKLLGSSPKERVIIKRRRIRELKAVFTADYGSVFQQKSIYLKVFTTLIWPYFGSAMGNVLLTIPSFNNFCNSFTSTPDESTYLAKLIGSLTIVVIKDFYNLFVAYKEVKQLSNIGVVEQLEENEEETQDKTEGEGEEEEEEEEENPDDQDLDDGVRDGEVELLGEQFRFDLESEEQIIEELLDSGQLRNDTQEGINELEAFRRQMRLRQCFIEADRRLMDRQHAFGLSQEAVESNIEGVTMYLYAVASSGRPFFPESYEEMIH